jgi:hypothetical protein
LAIGGAPVGTCTRVRGLRGRLGAALVGRADLVDFVRRGAAEGVLPGSLGVGGNGVAEGGVGMAGGVLALDDVGV